MFLYRAEVTIQVTAYVEAESYLVAEELLLQHLAPDSNDRRVDIRSADVVVDDMESDDDPVLGG